MNVKKNPRFLTPAWWKALLRLMPKPSTLRQSSTSYRNADGGTTETGPVEQK